MKQPSSIPIHKLNDRYSRGIFVRYIDPVITEKKRHITEAHRDDHYLFLFQQQGYSSFMIDFEEREVSGPALHCILPGQVHYIKAYNDVKGFFLAVDTLAVEEQYRRVFEQELLNLHSIIPDENTAGHLERCLHNLRLLLEDETAAANRPVVEALASAGIGIIADAFLRAENNVPQSASRSNSIARSFKTLLKQEYKSLKSPAEYASRLNISTAYLNECVKAYTGRSVSSFIQHEITLEARRLLYYSSLSVKEIAYELGFSDHAYFSRLFTRSVGMAPGQFRKSHHE